MTPQFRDFLLTVALVAAVGVFLALVGCSSTPVDNKCPIGYTMETHMRAEFVCTSKHGGTVVKTDGVPCNVHSYRVCAKLPPVPPSLTQPDGRPKPLYEILTQES